MPRFLEATPMHPCLDQFQTWNVRWKNPRDEVYMTELLAAFFNTQTRSRPETLQMRLINTETLRLDLFLDERTRPPYAILSHRWGQDEVSFKQFCGCHNDVSLYNQLKGHQGFVKIAAACSLARNRGWGWIWIDTCCIDTRSSTELTESINSMYRWYKSAAECIVFLHDFSHNRICSSSLSDALELCEWTGRGWTLQELLAPRWLVFCNERWDVIGHLHKWHGMNLSSVRHEDLRKNFSMPLTALEMGSCLLHELAEATRIPRRVLDHHGDLETESVAARMSWSSRRTTTRAEDMAYCLLGIFHVNMPLLYGEGDRAFQRLQEEIVRTSNDTSIFAWNEFGRTLRDRRAGILAPSPRNFTFCAHVEMGVLHGSKPYSLTNEGLQLETKAVQVSDLKHKLSSLAVWRLWSAPGTWRPRNRYILFLGCCTFAVEESQFSGRYVVCTQGWDVSRDERDAKVIKNPSWLLLRRMHRRTFIIQPHDQAQLSGVTEDDEDYGSRARAGKEASQQRDADLAAIVEEFVPPPLPPR